MFEYFVTRLTEHGYNGDREMMYEVLSIDVELNSQGLDVWLNRQK
jgi:hypothetical protein